MSLKRFVSDNHSELWKEGLKAPGPSGKKVAIVGSGPTGLTAGYYLTRCGHQVTIFEALPVAGGMMRVGVPEYRLPREVLDTEIEEIKSIGVDIRTNTRVESLDELLEQGYNAILLAVGAHQGQKLPLPGADLEGVLVNTLLLRDMSLGKEVKVGERVVVLGGGNVAFDCARTALRLGAAEVHIACLEPRDGMLATPEEIQWGEEEGIIIHPSHTFTKIVSDNGHITGIECLNVRSFEFDNEGRVHIDSIAGTEHILPADTVIFAIGQVPELGLVDGVSGIKTTRRHTLEVDSVTLATGKEGVFAAGDAVTGTTSVIEAIAAGRRAAISIDRYLGSSGEIDEALVDTEKANPYIGREEGFADRPRVLMPCLPVEQRLSSFTEVELGFGEAEAVEEAKRCLRCDLRFTISQPVLPPEKWLVFNAENVSAVPEKDGVFQLVDEQKMIIYIKGTANLRQELEAELATREKASYFDYEESFMYTGRESELLQKFLQEHGRLPEGNEELEELF